jgi:hypothetical protein
VKIAGLFYILILLQIVTYAGLFAIGGYNKNEGSQGMRK